MKNNHVNNQRNLKKTFFTLPKEETLRKAWIKRINRVDSLPKKVFVCEEHFLDECFNKSNELKIRFQEQGLHDFSMFLIFFITATFSNLIIKL